MPPARTETVGKWCSRSSCAALTKRPTVLPTVTRGCPRWGTSALRWPSSLPGRASGGGGWAGGPPQGDTRQGRYIVSLYFTTAWAGRVLRLLYAPWYSVGVLTA